MILIALTLLFGVLKCGVYSAKILVIGTMPAHSHFTLAFRLATELADRNHEVTFITPFPLQSPIKNLNEIFIEDVIAFVEEYRKILFKSDTLGPVEEKLSECDLALGLVEHLFNSKNVQKLLNSDQTFDVVVIEHFMNEAAVGIAHRFNAPFIFISPLASGVRTNHIFANPAPSSYVPNVLGSFTKHMNFWQRLHNFVSTNFEDVLRETLYLPLQRELFKKYTKTDLELDDVLYNVSVMLTNSHVSVNDAVPHVPSNIEIGGYHISPPKKLPQDLQSFLDNASEGVVLFAMGSNLKSKDLTLEVRSALLKSFSKIKESVLWKFETDLKEAPANVKIMSWLPQQDILAHPNVRAFITHGGLLSTIEAVYHGVPIIGIPVFGDQTSNIESAVSNGYAISVPLAELTEETFYRALNEILHNSKYTENVRTRSKLMHDQPLKPIDMAVYWIEHVIRHRGAPHLRSAGVDLSWYQREMIDIFVFFVTVIAALYAITFVILRKIFIKDHRKHNVIKIKKNK